MNTLGTRDVAALLGVSVNSIYRRRTYMPTSLPPAVKAGGRLRWQRSTVEKWLSEHETQSTNL